jgi:hypothetical protein
MMNGAQPYDYVWHYIYMGWYYKKWLTTIWYGMNTKEQLSQPYRIPRSLWMS